MIGGVGGGWIHGTATMATMINGQAKVLWTIAKLPALCGACAYAAHFATPSALRCCCWRCCCCCFALGLLGKSSSPCAADPIPAGLPHNLLNSCNCFENLSTSRSLSLSRSTSLSLSLSLLPSWKLAAFYAFDCCNNKQCQQLLPHYVWVYLFTVNISAKLYQLTLKRKLMQKENGVSAGSLQGRLSWWIYRIYIYFYTKLTYLNAAAASSCSLS